MDAAKLKVAVAEAKRFIERAKAYEQNQPSHSWVPSKEGGAVRRSSMDLTRALADLRRPS